VNIKNYTITMTITFLLTTIGAFGAETAKKSMSMDTPEVRQKMADVHQKMADCLRSDKPMSACKDEMMKSCHDSMGKEGCPMMKDMHGKMMGKDMGGDVTESSTEDHKKHHP